MKAKYDLISKNPDYSLIKEKLNKHFPKLAERELQEEIAQNGKIYKFPAGKMLLDFGSYIKIFPLVTQGSIKVLREDDQGNEIFLYYITEGDACSMYFTCCMMNKKSIIRTFAEDDSEIIGIPVRYPDQWISNYQSWKNFILMSYDDRMYSLIKTIDEIAFKKMDERLLHYLQGKAEIQKSKIIHATHQEIAHDLNASREAVSRLLKQLEKAGILQLGRNQITVEP
jgi:CRP/FNR family transcriptional regulator